jgi:hypothetical protein
MRRNFNSRFASPFRTVGRFDRANPSEQKFLGPIVLRRNAAPLRFKSSVSGGGTVERSKGKAKRQSGTHFVHRMTIRESMPQSDVETEIIANLPNETDQSGYGVELAE